METRHNINDSEFNKIIVDLENKLSFTSNVIFAYVHGSFLKKKNFGDIDIAVYVSGKRDCFNMEFLIEEKIQRGIRFPVDVKILNNAPPAFCYNVMKNGLKLIDKDERIRDLFTRKVLKMYFDFLPYRRRYLEEVLRNEI